MSVSSVATLQPAAAVFREEQYFDWRVYALIASVGLLVAAGSAAPERLVHRVRCWGWSSGMGLFGVVHPLPAAHDHRGHPDRRPGLVRLGADLPAGRADAPRSAGSNSRPSGRSPTTASGASAPAATASARSSPGATAASGSSWPTGRSWSSAASGPRSWPRPSRARCGRPPEAHAPPPLSGSPGFAPAAACRCCATSIFRASMIIGGIARDVARRPSFMRSRRVGIGAGGSARSAAVPASNHRPSEHGSRSGAGGGGGGIGFVSSDGSTRESATATATGAGICIGSMGSSGPIGSGKRIGAATPPAGGRLRIAGEGRVGRIDRRGAGFVAGTADLEDLADGPHQGPPAGELIAPQPLAGIAVVEGQGIQPARRVGGVSALVGGEQRPRAA